ncbi:hypothetical protein CDAR_545241 [Caerostris darwini]|uniref:Uncharacterized protein n=1 Tax=Caerostris darwini TaxID=1538125 RepID=A0AAV4W414_9ARAC|nr:hypothetical protein CDAR_545241 [Caerostris darwini]
MMTSKSRPSTSSGTTSNTFEQALRFHGTRIQQQHGRWGMRCGENFVEGVEGWSERSTSVMESCRGASPPHRENIFFSTFFMFFSPSLPLSTRPRAEEDSFGVLLPPANAAAADGVIGGPGLNFRGRRKHLHVSFLPFDPPLIHPRTERDSFGELLPPVIYKTSLLQYRVIGGPGLNFRESQSSFEFVVEPPKTTFNSRPVTPGVSYASFLRGPPPAAPSGAKENQYNLFHCQRARFRNPDDESLKRDALHTVHRTISVVPFKERKVPQTQSTGHPDSGKL